MSIVDVWSNVPAWVMVTVNRKTTTLPTIGHVGASIGLTIGRGGLAPCGHYIPWPLYMAPYIMLTAKLGAEPAVAE
jgi:hypothetical protein